MAFEKHYEDVEKKIVARSCATYVMGLHNFVDVSKLSKPEIIRGIKRGELKGVKRHYHRTDMDRWISAVSQTLAGDDYSAQVINYIDGLVSSQVVTKRGDKK